jgi:hypothetical protein
MSAEKDRETISAASTAAPVPAGAVFVSYTSAYFAIQIRHTFFPPESTHGLL